MTKKDEKASNLALTTEEHRRELEFLRFVRKTQELASKRGFSVSVFDIITEAHQMARSGRDWCAEKKDERSAENFESSWGIEPLRDDE